jgi:hypothetical protein
MNVSGSLTAKVTDDSPSGPILPTGFVSFSARGSGVFGTVSCTSSGTTLTCTVNFALSYVPSAGSDKISAVYLGDATHDESIGTFRVDVA